METVVTIPKAFHLCSCDPSCEAEFALTNLLLDVRGLVRCRSGQDAGVGEAGLQQCDDHKYEEDSSNHRYAAGQVFDQEGTAGGKGATTDREKMN